jgi:3-hydroxyisobutyrate dehydrogenase-like beta-hydroxyacid dehydrogenase
MGRGIAQNLLAAGHDLTIWNRTPGRTSDLAEAGARVASSVTQASEGSEVVITVMADDHALEAVADELLSALAAGAIHLIMGTHGIDAIDRLARRHAEHRQEFVAAPVIGRPQVAAAGELLILVGGDPDAVSRCSSLFEAVGRATVAAGTEPMTAAAMKLANNFAIAAAVETMAETLAFARAYGIAPAVMHDVLISGIFRGSPVYRGYGQRMVEETYEPAGFRAELALKDVDLVRAAADARGVPLPSANVCRDTLVAAIDHGDGDLDWAVVARERARAARLD